VSNSWNEGSPPESRRGPGWGRVSGDNSKSLPDFARLFFEQADQWIAWIDSEARLVSVNPSLCRALGYSAAELCSLRVWDVSPTTEESWPLLWSEVKQGLSRSIMAELRTRSGGVLPAQLDVKPVTVDGAEYWICVGQELPEHAALDDCPASAADAIFVLHKGCVVVCNRKDAELFGCPRRQIIEEVETAVRGLPPSLRGQDFTFSWQSRRPDASPFNIECTVSRMKIEGHVLAVAVDGTARRKSERTLAQLSGRLLQMQDEERRRIARELHDTTGQNLGALSINLSLLLATTGLDPRSREMLEESLALTDASVSEIRTMSYQLHPPLLDELGLASALRAYCEGYAERTGLGIELDLPTVPRLPQAIEIALFRIVQEGLANIHRHSGSPTATVRLKHFPDRVELEVADQGCGLPPRMFEGVGIAGMRERASQLGGRLTIGSSETGTTLHVVLPCQNAADW
jgi:PAS domain S-box-containing protein